MVCDNEFTKFESNSVSDICSDECRKINKNNWEKEYAKKTETKANGQIRAEKYRRKKKTENTEWNRKPLVKKECEYCTTVFETRGERRNYCDSQCVYLSRLQQLREETKLRAIEKDCVVCGKTFSTNSKVHKFCGRKCNDVSYFSDPMNRLTANIRKAVHKALKTKKTTKTNNTFSSLGYTIDELKIHLESQFEEEMSWDNMGEWHIDHIRPISSFEFDSSDHPDFKACWALDNLQPLWAMENLRKSDKWDPKFSVDFEKYQLDLNDE